MSYSNAPIQKTNGLSIAALITGIVGLSLLAVIFGHVSLGQIKTRSEAGRGMAIAGLVLGYLGSVGWIFWILVIGAAAAGSSGY